MKVSSRGEYAMRAMLELALRYGEGPVPIAEIARAQDVPRRYLEQILLVLQRGQFARSVRGPSGGYYLHRPPDTVRVADVIRAMDGPLAPVPCVSQLAYEECPRQGGCGLRWLWKQARDLLADLLENTTLAELVAHDSSGPRTSVVADNSGAPSGRTH